MVRAEPNVSANQYVDALVLATNPGQCEALLLDGLGDFRKAAAAASELTQNSEDSVYWLNLRETLTASGAIDVTDDGRFIEGSQWESMRLAYPHRLKDLIPHVVRAWRNLRSIQDGKRQADQRTQQVREQVESRRTKELQPTG
jgi:hypothetical protein